MNVGSALVVALGLLMAISAAGTPPQEPTSSEPLVWQPSVGPLTGSVRALVESEAGAIFAYVNSEIYRSRDDGMTWARCPSQPERRRDAVIYKPALVATGRRLYATGDYKGPMYVSDDDCESSRPVPLPPGTSDQPDRLTAIDDALVAAYLPARVFRSSDEGRTWTLLAQPVASPEGGTSVRLDTRRGSVLSGTSHGVLRSTDGGLHWTTTGMPGQRVFRVAARQGLAYASMADGTFWTSEDAGLSWSRVETTFSGSPGEFGWPSHVGQVFIVDDRHLRAGGDRELLASSDGGRTWSLAGLSKQANALIRSRDTWFAATSQGVFRSIDLAHWTECSSGLYAAGIVRSLVATPQGDLIAVQGHAVFRSQDHCGSWWPLGAPIPPSSNRGYDTPLQVSADETLGIVVWGDGIAQWSPIDGKWMVRAKTPLINAFVRDDRGRYWLGTTAGVSRLSIAGSEWRLVPAGLDGSVASLAIDPSGYLIAAIDDRGVFRARVP